MKQRSLYVKFNFLIVGTIFLCGLLVSAIMLYTVVNSLEEGLDRSGHEIAASLGGVAGSDILVDDRFALAQHLARTKEDNGLVRYIIAVSPKGTVLASTFAAGLPAGLPPQREAAMRDGIDAVTYASNEGNIREILYPIDSGVMGYLRVGLTERQMTSLIQQRCLQLALLIFVICLASAWLASRYAGLFLQPIFQLSQAANALGLGDYEVSVPVASKDEIGQLAYAFNSMTRRLRLKNQENSRLFAELQEKEKIRVMLLQQLFSAREDERQRISRELHDESGQSMASILAYLRILHDKLMTTEQRELLYAIRELTADTLAGLRNIAVDLHPPLLEDLGLLVAIQKHLEAFRQGQPELQVDFYSSGDFRRVSHEAALVCYRTLQEALTNIVRHAEADCIVLELAVFPMVLRLLISDNGIGFDEQQAEEARLDRHMGLVSMRERVELMDGSFMLRSEPGKGTRIIILLPVSGWSKEGRRMDGKEEIADRSGR